MITKEQREKDRALCHAVKGVTVADNLLWRESTIVGEVDNAEREGVFIKMAVERLPLYIADADEFDRRLADLEGARAALLKLGIAEDGRLLTECINDLAKKRFEAGRRSHLGEHFWDDVLPAGDS